jgi:hypothetical protein
MSGKLLLTYICNFHVLSHLLFIYICKLHWNTILIKDPSGKTAKHGEVSYQVTIKLTPKLSQLNPKMYPQFDNIFWTEATQDDVFRYG